MIFFYILLPRLKIEMSICVGKLGKFQNNNLEKPIDEEAL